MNHRVLLVANETLGGEALATVLRDRVAAGATDLWIVVPATRPRDDFALARVATGTRLSAVPTEESPGVELAERRLQEALYRFGDLGIPVGGEVGDEDPFRAASDVLSRGGYDEVVVSTLPTGLSHWLRADLPGRLHRRFPVPVTTVTARA